MWNQIKIYFSDAYYMIFKYPSDTELRLQHLERDGTEAEHTRLDQHYRSYTALKQRHKRYKFFVLSLIPLTILITLGVFVIFTFILNLLFTMLGVDNNPFHIHHILSSAWDFLKWNIFAIK